jgi:hypothetical protein
MFVILFISRQDISKGLPLKLRVVEVPCRNVCVRNKETTEACQWVQELPEREALENVTYGGNALLHRRGRIYCR